MKFCESKRILRHTLSTCTLGLKERYTWRHNEVLRVLKKYSDKTIADINKGKLPTAVVKKKIDFYKEGLKGDETACNNSKVEDKRWG